MADDSKPAWSPVFLRGTTSGQARSRRGEHQRRQGVAREPSVGEMIDEFLDAVDDGFARDRYGRPFSAEAAQEMHWSLGGHVGEELGAMGLSDLRRSDIEALIYQLADGGVPRRRLRALAKSVRALYDYAAELDVVRHNPAERLAIPDEDEAEQPTATDVTALAPRAEQGIVDRGIALALRLATLAFLLLAVALLAGSL
jgi:site-specific recombinase XerC